MDQYHYVEQTVVYWVNLPQFILNFKSKVINLILPHLLQLKKIVNNEDNSQVVNPVIIIIALLIVLITLKNIWTLLFQKRSVTQPQSTQSKELNNQVNDLKKQLKSLKTSFHELTKQLNNKQLSEEPQAKQQTSKNTESSISEEALNNLLNLYNVSLNQNKSLINYVLESQCQVLKQLKKFKKLNRNSLSSNGRPSMSTVRSKTTEKKLESKDKSPFKVPSALKSTQSALKATTQSKKIELKSTQKPLKQQIFIKKIQETVPSPKIHQQNIVPEVKPQIKMPVRSPQKPLIPPVPNRQMNSKVQKPIMPKIEAKQNQQMITPGNLTAQTQLNFQNEVKVEVQTFVKKTQSIEIIETNNQVQTIKSQQTSSIETKIETIEQNISLSQQTNELNPITVQQQEVEQIIVIAPQKPPQFKKNLGAPGMKGGMKKPPPPPIRK